MIDYFLDFGNNLQLKANQVMSYEVVEQDYDVDPERTIDGRLFRNRVAMIPEVTFEVVPMRKVEMEALLKALSKVEFSVKYFNPTSGGYKTALFYCGPSSRKVKVRRGKNGALDYEAHTFTLTGIHHVG